MNERFSPCQISNIEQTGKEALDIIDRTYGEGYPAWTRGRHELSYHNGHHGRSVGQGALRLCVSMGIESDAARIGEMAGYTHDLVQLKGRGKDEAESAEWFEQKLRQRGIDQHYARMGGLAIRGTEPLFKGNKIVGQKATTLSYSDKESEKVAYSVACGDFGEMYTPQGPYMAHQLFQEIKGMPNESAIPFDDMPSFQRNQIELLEEYQYPLKQANTVLATHKPQVIRYAQTTLKQLEDGTIETWDELLRRDQAFIRQHS